jgi:hypothetical protein
MHGLLSATWLKVFRVFMGTYPLDILSRNIGPDISQDMYHAPSSV